MFFFCTKIVEAEPQKKKPPLAEIASANLTFRCGLGDSSQE
jgi:hypothetical protein